MSIKILVDSASDISLDEAKIFNIELIPLIVSFGEKEYYDGVDLLPQEFYEKLVEDEVMPKTSQITSTRFEQKYKEMLETVDQVLVITLSSKLSGTYSSAVIAARKFENKVFVVDSMNVATGERLLCEYALRLVYQNLSIQKIVEELEIKKNKINIIAMLNTLEYLKKGGRLSSAAAIAGEFLSIKPVVTLIDGEVKVIGKAIGSKRGNNLLNKLIISKGGIDFDMPYGVLWSGFDDTLLNKYIKDSSHLWIDHTDQINSYIVGSTIGTHVGPGAIGFAFFSK